MLDLEGHRIARRAIERVEYVDATASEEAHVAIATRKSVTKIYVAPGDAAELLRALEFAAEGIGGTFAAVASLSTLAAWLGLASIAIGLATFFAALILNLPPMIFAAAALVIAPLGIFKPATVDLGADGLVYRTTFGERFVAWSEVTGIELLGAGMLVQLGTRELWVPVTWTDRGSEAAAALVKSAREAWWTFRDDAPAQMEDRLARAGRTREQWLRDLADREGDFRTAPIRDDDLWTVLEDPGARATARAAAAALLARTGGDADRFRIAAEACASPKVRVVLEAAASGAEPDAIEKALDDVTDESAT